MNLVSKSENVVFYQMHLFYKKHFHEQRQTEIGKKLSKS